MRGRLASRPVADVLGEAERLAAAGVKELLVISQDTSAYGSDLRYAAGRWRGQERRAHVQDLSEALAELGVWVRLHYVYPYPHVDQLIALMADSKVLPYLDIPFQHASPRVLKAMRRPAAAENTLRRIASWRRECPELVLRSTFIVGFPGETEEDFETLLEFLDAAEIDRAGCFTYSPVHGAEANALDDHIPPDEQADRQARFMAVQQAVSRDRLAQRVGREYEVLVDEVGNDGSLLARSYAEAPEVDGVIRVSGPPAIRAGQKLRVRVVASDDHDLSAVPV
jgi:ribosomal protein S12 methylthiotransferase